MWHFDQEIEMYKGQFDGEDIDIPTQKFKTRAQHMAQISSEEITMSLKALSSFAWLWWLIVWGLRKKEKQTQSLLTNLIKW